MGSAAKGFVGLTGVMLGALILIFLVPRYLEEPPPEQVVSGTVAEVRLPNRSDIVLILRGDQRTYLVEGGIENGHPFTEWGDHLIEKPVELHVARFTWSSGRPTQQDVPVEAVFAGGELYFRVRN